MKANSFTARAGRPATQDSRNLFTRIRQIEALGGVPVVDQATGLVTADGIDQPELAAWPLGILYHRRMISREAMIAGGMHAWARGLVHGRLAASERIVAGLQVAEAVGGGGDSLGWVSALGAVARADEGCMAQMTMAYRDVEAGLMSLGPHIHGTVAALVLYEARPDWWLDTRDPRGTGGYLWTNLGLTTLVAYWPAMLAAIHDRYIA